MYTWRELLTTSSNIDVLICLLGYLYNMTDVIQLYWRHFWMSGWYHTLASGKEKPLMRVGYQMTLTIMLALSISRKHSVCSFDYTYTHHDTMVLVRTCVHHREWETGWSGEGLLWGDTCMHMCSVCDEIKIWIIVDFQSTYHEIGLHTQFKSQHHDRKNLFKIDFISFSD